MVIILPFASYHVSIDFRNYSIRRDELINFCMHSVCETKYDYNCRNFSLSVNSSMHRGAFGRRDGLLLHINARYDTSSGTVPLHHGNGLPRSTSPCTSAQWVDWLWNRRVEYWAIRSSVPSFARTAHSFACSALIASSARSAQHSLTPELMGKRLMSMHWTRRFHTDSTHCAVKRERIVVYAGLGKFLFF